MEDTENSKDREIDLIELAEKIWLKRRFVLKVAAIALVAGIVVAFSIPKEYKTEVILSPESTSDSNKGLKGMAASMMGMNMQEDYETLPPEIFPDIVKSSPFIIGLFNIRVVDTKKDIDTTLYSYMKYYQKNSWWSYIMALPSMGMNLLFGYEDEEEQIKSPSSQGAQKSVISLTKEQSGILGAIKGRISVSVDKKTDVITLTSVMQSPEISAYIADTVIAYMQSYIIGYRTEKARQDLIFAEKMFEEAKANYYKVQQKYAAFLDENINITSSRYKTREESLRNELTLAYGLYNQMAQQQQAAKIKVQDMTPVYSVIQPAVVPIRASSPRKTMIMVGFVFLAVFIACSWILAKDYLLTLKSESKNHSSIKV